MAIKPTSMTITDALIKIKNIKKQLNIGYGNSRYVHIIPATLLSSKSKASKDTLEAFKKDMQSAYDKSSSLISNYIALKSAITYTNSTTRIEYMGKYYYLAELISLNSREVKEPILKMLNEMKNKSNEEVLKDLDMANKGAIIEQCKSMDALKSSNLYSIYDPLNNAERIKELCDFYEEFFENLDSLLSKINSTTTISVELEG